VAWFVNVIDEATKAFARGGRFGKEAQKAQFAADRGDFRESYDRHAAAMSRHAAAMDAHSRVMREGAYGGGARLRGGWNQGWNGEFLRENWTRMNWQVGAFGLGA
jgi:hypothetical protein